MQPISAIALQANQISLIVSPCSKYQICQTQRDLKAAINPVEQWKNPAITMYFTIALAAPSSHGFTCLSCNNSTYTSMMIWLEKFGDLGKGCIGVNCAGSATSTVKVSCFSWGITATIPRKDIYLLPRCYKQLRSSKMRMFSPGAVNELNI